MSLQSDIESLLFASSQPLSLKKIAALTGSKASDVERELDSLEEAYRSRGIRLVRNDGSAQFATSPESAELVREFLKEDTVGELTRPALETLSVIAYRGPVGKSEIERIRGVNCSQSLRNLMIRGLIDAREDSSRGETVYTVSFDFLHHLGLTDIRDLPDYESLAHVAAVEELVALSNDADDTSRDTKIASTDDAPAPSQVD